MSKGPIAFMSYVRVDDQHEAGRLSEFCKRLSSEMHMQTGDPFRIFQDRNDIAWGQQWKKRIDESIDAVTFLIPIITPGFFKSPACRAELERFREREKEMERSDLILPVYYVNCPILNDEAKRGDDPLAKALANRQWADWREVRFEPFTSPVMGKMLAKMATQIVEALERGQPAHPPAPVTVAAGVPRKQNSDTIPAMKREREEAAAQSPETPRGPAYKTEPPTLVVDALHRGDHPTLTDALKAAKPGDRILVRPGLYNESVVIDKPVEIIGDGELSEIVVEASAVHVVRFEASMGRIANLTLRHGGASKGRCVDITQGRLELEGCDITSRSLACVAIHGGADPRLRRNRIHDGASSGVFVYENGQGTLEDNDISGNAKVGVAIARGGNPTVRRNRIHDCKMGGVFVYENGQGTLEDNDISSNADLGIEISEGGNPTVRRNRIHDGKKGGVMVRDNGQGLFENNEIFANARTGVEIKTGGKPTLRGNRIFQNHDAAIWVHSRGQGVFEDNDLRGNANGAWDISPDCKDKVKRTGNEE